MVRKNEKKIHKVILTHKTKIFCIFTQNLNYALQITI